MPTTPLTKSTIRLRSLIMGSLCKHLLTSAASTLPVFAAVVLWQSELIGIPLTAAGVGVGFGVGFGQTGSVGGHTVAAASAFLAGIIAPKIARAIIAKSIILIFCIILATTCLI